MENQNKVETFKEDAIITLKFGPDVYRRLVMILLSMVEGKTSEEMSNAAKQIELKKIDDEWVLHYETILYMVKACEEYAKQNNMTEWKDMPESMTPSI